MFRLYVESLYTSVFCWSVIDSRIRPLEGVTETVTSLMDSSPRFCVGGLLSTLRLSLTNKSYNAFYVGPNLSWNFASEQFFVNFTLRLNHPLNFLFAVMRVGRCAFWAIGRVWFNAAMPSYSRKRLSWKSMLTRTGNPRNYRCCHVKALRRTTVHVSFMYSIQWRHKLNGGPWTV